MHHHRGALLSGLWAVALLLGAAAAGPGVQAAPAPVNLIANPSGVGGSTAGWTVAAGPSWGTLTAVKLQGQWWLHWVSPKVQSHQPNPGFGWTVYPLPNAKPGAPITCGLRATGSGTIVEDIWSGNGDNFTKAVTLSSKPTTFTETVVVAPTPWPAPPQLQVRYNNQKGNIDVYFQDATCVIGHHVTLQYVNTEAARGLVLPPQQPVTLAPTASPLCAKGPSAASSSAVPSGTVSNIPPGQAVIEPSSGDGPWLLEPFQHRLALYGMGYYAPSGAGYVYISSNGGLPSGTRTVMLCVEYYDGSRATSPSGDWLTVQYSGTNPKGPVNGAYDNSTEVYALTGTHRWLTASFTLTDINFAPGDKGIGAENLGADFRVFYNTPTYFDRFWLVTTGVKPTAALAAANMNTLKAFIAKYH